MDKFFTHCILELLVRVGNLVFNTSFDEKIVEALIKVLCCSIGAHDFGCETTFGERAK